jgi:glycogen(starch) synthase
VKVLTIGLLYPPHHRGGYEMVCDGVMRTAAIHGHDVRVLASDYRVPGVGERDLLPVYRELRSYLDSTAQHVVAYSPRQRLALERHNGAVLDRHLHDFDPDVVSWWAMGGMSLSMIERVRRRGTPSVLAIHDTWPVYGPKSDGWTRMCDRRALQALAPLLEPACGVPVRHRLEASGRFLFNSAYTRDAVAAAGVRPADSAVLTPGVHARYRPDPADLPWRGRLLYVGRIDPVKGVDLLLQALARLPAEVTLTIVGSGEVAYERRLRKEVDVLGLDGRVDFAGPLEADALRAAYAGTDAVVFPVRWQEPWGLVPLEAMAVGRPVIATAQGGAATYLRDRVNAIVIPPEDPRAVADAVLRLGADPGLRARLIEGGLRTAVEHSADRYEQAMIDELDRAAAQH